jgi:hypothetical protein
VTASIDIAEGFCIRHEFRSSGRDICSGSKAGPERPTTPSGNWRKPPRQRSLIPSAPG